MSYTQCGEHGTVMFVLTFRCGIRFEIASMWFIEEAG